MPKHSLLLAAILALAASTASAQTPKIGVFDPAKLLSSSKMGQKLQDTLNQYRVTKEGELKKLKDEFDKRLEQYKAGVETMSPERKEEVETDLASRRRELERISTDADQELGRRRQKAVRDIEQEVSVILEDYGKKNGYTVILQRDFCAFATEAIDISDQLVQLLDVRRPQG
jgi:outer membrane protein